MFKSPLSVSKIFPEEYRAVTEELFPSGGFPQGKGPSQKTVQAFADILGLGEDFRQLLSSHRSGRAVGDFLERFQNNLDLLIQKTWVDKSEEARKEKLLDNIPPLIASIEKGDYAQALEEFGPILDELAYLFFGAQSQKEDFSEYALRIDEQMGLFWWYGAQINALRGASWVKNAGADDLQALLLVGICYLTNF